MSKKEWQNRWTVYNKEQWGRFANRKMKTAVKRLRRALEAVVNLFPQGPSEPQQIEAPLSEEKWRLVAQQFSDGGDQLQDADGHSGQDRETPTTVDTPAQHFGDENREPSACNSGPISPEQRLPRLLLFGDRWPDLRAAAAEPLLSNEAPRFPEQQSPWSRWDPLFANFHNKTDPSADYLLNENPEELYRNQRNDSLNSADETTEEHHRHQPHVRPNLNEEYLIEDMPDHLWLGPHRLVEGHWQDWWYLRPGTYGFLYPDGYIHRFRLRQARLSRSRTRVLVGNPAENGLGPGEGALTIALAGRVRA
ncbi:hypothetical protein BCR34DRAFT_200174 [Clohesyomyces aquaticus]|uniref:Uncharacterized protein n=1 Tax=Clohesyomyces aquaticus TaxID=1231657 RepID=A0A1Y1YB30_9PLEO|nr:hypothetical protein BCR34DRAFT_200174 [Clohesyomyces aquaticus]